MTSRFYVQQDQHFSQVLFVCVHMTQPLHLLLIPRSCNFIEEASQPPELTLIIVSSEWIIESCRFPSPNPCTAVTESVFTSSQPPHSEQLEVSFKVLWKWEHVWRVLKSHDDRYARVFIFNLYSFNSTCSAHCIVSPFSLIGDDLTFSVVEFE